MNIGIGDNAASTQMLAASAHMKKFHTFVSPVFSVSALAFVAVIIFGVEFGGFQPDGPVNGRGMIVFFGVPLSLVGMVVGLLLSVIKTVICFRSSARKNPDEHI